MGLTEDFVDDSCPKDLEPYRLANEIKMQEQDTLAWISGMYFKSALETVLSAMLGNRNAEYKTESILAKINEYAGMTQDEIDEIEIRKMIANEEKWITFQKAKGMKTIDELSKGE